MGREASPCLPALGTRAAHAPAKLRGIDNALAATGVDAARVAPAAARQRHALESTSAAVCVPASGAACVRACERACVRACVRVCVRACVRAGVRVQLVPHVTTVTLQRHTVTLGGPRATVVTHSDTAAPESKRPGGFRTVPRMQAVARPVGRSSPLAVPRAGGIRRPRGVAVLKGVSRG